MSSKLEAAAFFPPEEENQNMSVLHIRERKRLYADGLLAEQKRLESLWQNFDQIKRHNYAESCNGLCPAAS